MTNYKSADDVSSGVPNLASLHELQTALTKIKNVVAVEKISVSATSGTAGITSTNIPVGSEIVDVVAQANVTNGSGTARLSVGGGGANITDAIVMAVIDVPTGAGTIDQTYKYVTAAGVTVTTNADADAGDVYVYYK